MGGGDDDNNDNNQLTMGDVTSAWFGQNPSGGRIVGVITTRYELVVPEARWTVRPALDRDGVRSTIVDLYLQY